MTRTLIIGSLLALGACSSTATVSPTTAATIATATPAVQTLATLAASQNKTINQIVTEGQLFCQSSAGLIAVVGALSSPSSVIGVADTVVAKACPVINGIQTTPAPVSAVPVVVTAPAASLAKTTP